LELCCIGLEVAKISTDGVAVCGHGVWGQVMGSADTICIMGGPWLRPRGLVVFMASVGGNCMWADGRPSNATKKNSAYSVIPR